MRLPKDDGTGSGGNLIPDSGWIGGGLPISDPHALTFAGEDADNQPTGDGTTGDGLSAYEEYRGFLVGGTHLRTDPTKKDVFVYSQFVVEGAGYATTLPLPLHLIFDNEHVSHRIAPNYLNAGFGGAIPGHFFGTLLNNQQREQQIIYVAKNETYAMPPPPPPGQSQDISVGVTDSEQDAQGNAVLGPPWTVGSGSAVFMKRLRFISPTTNNELTPDPTIDDPKVRQTIAHEIGHNLALKDVNHPQTNSVPPLPQCPPTATTVMVSHYFLPSSTISCAWAAIPNSYIPSDLTQLRVK